MSNIVKALIFILGFFGVFGIVGMWWIVLRDTGKTPPRPDLQLDALIAEKGYSDAGLSVSITRNQRNSTHVIYDKHWPAGADGQTRYDLGSLDELFIAMAVMALHDQGALDLDQAVGALMPDLPQPLQSIAVADLLAHRSGLDPALTDALAATDLEPEAAEAGRYSPADYDLLWRLVGRVSGKPAHEYIRQTVLDPVGADCIGFEPVEGEAADPLTRSRGGRWLGCADGLRIWDLALNSNRVVRFNTMKRGFLPPLTPSAERAAFAFAWKVFNVKGFRVELAKARGRGNACLARFSQRDFAIALLSGAPADQLDMETLAMEIAEIYLGREMPLRHVPEAGRAAAE